MKPLLFTRRGCHLCEQAEDLLAILCPEAVLVDIDASAEYTARYGLRVPVLHIDGVDVLEGRIDEKELATVLRVGGRGGGCHARPTGTPVTGRTGAPGG